MDLRLAVLAIGDELLDGERADTNTALIAALLGEHGYRLRESLTVGDEEQDIVAALEGLSRQRDVLIVTGGLGPTTDDRTARAAARAFGRRLVLCPEALEQIRAFFRERGLPMEPRNEKQALLPERALVLPNRRGTAPGFLLHSEGRDLFFLPGVPGEMRAMLQEEVIPHLAERTGGLTPRRQRRLKVFGIPEPRIETLLARGELPPEVTVSFAVEFPEVHVRLRAAGEEAEGLLDRAELVARQALGEAVIAVGEETLAGNVARLLTAGSRTLALAESCTGGLVAQQLTEIPGASAFLERGAVTYANRAKAQWLGVPERVLEEAGAVSEECALAMARGIRAAAQTDLGLAITGIAGPGGGTPDKPAGTVYLALAAAGTEEARRYRFAGDRHQVRVLSAHMALAWLQRYLVAGQT